MRYATRTLGFRGKCEKQLAKLEGQIFGELANLYANNANFRSEVGATYQHLIMDNPAFSSGRLGASLLSAYFTPKVGRSTVGKVAQDIGWEALLASGALVGDLRHAIEAAVKGGLGGLSPEDIANALVTGNVSDLLNSVDLDSECQCQ